jgi:hypothetical protein
LGGKTGPLFPIGCGEIDRDGLIDLTHRSSDGTLMTEVLQLFLSLKNDGPLFDFKFQISNPEHDAVSPGISF